MSIFPDQPDPRGKVPPCTWVCAFGPILLAHVQQWSTCKKCRSHRVRLSRAGDSDHTQDGRTGLPQPPFLETPGTDPERCGSGGTSVPRPVVAARPCPTLGPGVELSCPQRGTRQVPGAAGQAACCGGLVVNVVLRFSAGRTSCKTEGFQRKDLEPSWVLAGGREL